MTNLNLSELTLENAGQWPPMVKYIVAGILAMLVIGLGYWLIIKSYFEEYDSLKTTQTALKTEFEQKQRQAANLQAYRTQMQVMTARFGKMLKQLPAQNEMPGLLEDISKTGISSGLTFELFAPAPEVVHDFYIEVPINIVVIGNYHQLAVFLSRVAQMSRIVTLHDFEINTVKEEKQKTASGDLLEMKLTAKIYRYKS
ncbi:Tfp pilus assembly protein PilO [Legionella birminghamensis]|uniref:Tfp pilus assembly protein PilO n=1 Tax=Legionella birminghamensis TaxID=28083 RepID=A0A378IBH2_9GAMM|nr:type 4a pilus biogenesis protein PilO [Legionella birminghamensis]KTC76120.1 Tfp pilus assembly protein PilO [Legionella birminghamensis]STX32256.1 Tfp pilus assembly protein PilO [Legionella birminghamensis]